MITDSSVDDRSANRFAENATGDNFIGHDEITQLAQAIVCSDNPAYENAFGPAPHASTTIGPANGGYLGRYLVGHTVPACLIEPRQPTPAVRPFCPLALNLTNTAHILDVPSLIAGEVDAARHSHIVPPFTTFFLSK